MEPAKGAQTVAKLRKSPPAEIGGKKVVSVKEFPEANLLRIWLGEEGGAGIRVQIRPSGTEPKVKLYGEAVGTDPAPYLKAASDLLEGQGERRKVICLFMAHRPGIHTRSCNSALDAVVCFLTPQPFEIHEQW